MTLEELKSAAFVVGMKETERAVEKQEAACVFIASDCDERISRPLMEACQSSGIPVEQGFTKKEIGRACGIKVKAASAAVLKSRSYPSGLCSGGSIINFPLWKGGAHFADNQSAGS